jgi:hypothetical protein
MNRKLFRNQNQENPSNHKNDESDQSGPRNEVNHSRNGERENQREAEQIRHLANIASDDIKLEQEELGDQGSVSFLQKGVARSGQFVE